jgi:hypothetical protein
MTRRRGAGEKRLREAAQRVAPLVDEVPVLVVELDVVIEPQRSQEREVLDFVGRVDAEGDGR